MNLFLLLTVLVCSVLFVQSQSAQPSYMFRLSLIGCESRIELPYNDFWCKTPFKMFFSKKIYLRITLFNQGNFLYKNIMTEQLTDTCTVQELLYNYVYDYGLIRQYLGASTLTLCPLVTQLPLANIMVERIPFPAGLATGNYRLNIMVMDEKQVEYFHLDLYIYLQSNQPAGFFDFLFG